MTQQLVDRVKVDRVKVERAETEGRRETRSEPDRHDAKSSSCRLFDVFTRFEHRAHSYGIVWNENKPFVKGEQVYQVARA